jgi:hypothetical protein
MNVFRKIRLWYFFLGTILLDATLFALGFGVFDVRQAVTLGIIEVPIGVGVAVIVGKYVEKSVKEAEQLGEAIGKNLQKAQANLKRIEELKELLNDHYNNDLLAILKSWFQPEGPGVLPKPLDYVLKGSSAFVVYNPNNQEFIQNLSEPNGFSKASVERTMAHLRIDGPQEWDNWIALKEKSRIHLKHVADIWDCIEINLRNSIGKSLPEWDGMGDIPSEYYRIRDLVENVWLDYEYYANHHSHIWESLYPIQQDGNSWKKDNTWARSNDKKKLESLDDCLTGENERIKAERDALLADKNDLINEIDSFQQFLKKVIDKYEDNIRVHKQISSTCERCSEWVKELNRLEN